MSTKDLKREVETLEEQLESAKEILKNRKGISLFKCAECGKTDPDDDVIYEHLLNDQQPLLIA